MYIWDFSRSEGAGSATSLKTRGLTRSVMALMVPPLPAASRPSKTIMTRRPFFFTHSCRLQSSVWSLRNSFMYALFLSLDLLLPFFFSSFAMFPPVKPPSGVGGTITDQCRLVGSPAALQPSADQPDRFGP